MEPDDHPDLDRLYASFRATELHRQQEQRAQQQLESLLTELLPIADALAEATRCPVPDGEDWPCQAPDDTRLAPKHSPAELARRLEIVGRMLGRALGRAGVERMRAIGAPFDAGRHFAVSVEEVDAHAADVVLREIEPGYLWSGRVLKLASVVVGRASVDTANLSTEPLGGGDAGNRD